MSACVRGANRNWPSEAPALMIPDAKALYTDKFVPVRF
jgi:hypothetical protein